MPSNIVKTYCDQILLDIQNKLPKNIKKCFVTNLIWIMFTSIAFYSNVNNTVGDPFNSISISMCTVIRPEIKAEISLGVKTHLSTFGGS